MFPCISWEGPSFTSCPRKKDRVFGKNIPSFQIVQERSCAGTVSFEKTKQKKKQSIVDCVLKITLLATFSPKFISTSVTIRHQTISFLWISKKKIEKVKQPPKIFNYFIRLCNLLSYSLVHFTVICISRTLWSFNLVVQIILVYF